MLESGQELSAGFILVRRLGAGGSGTVWLAQDRERGCFVAVKVLGDELMRHEAAIAALRAECERVMALDHPNVLRVDGLYSDARHAWIAMEYASGGDLSQLRGGDCTAILRATVPVAAALAHAHAAGIIHRDVKPANVLFASDGTVRLADFGTALAAGCVPASDAGRGSLYSMSPQQRAGAAASPADDIYGFGAMLYELLCGYPPFYQALCQDRTTARAGMAGAVREPGEATAQGPVQLPQTVPPVLAQLVARLLAAAPADRPADMSSVERELNAVLAGLPASKIVNKLADTVNDPSPIRIEPPGLRAPGAPSAHAEPLRGEWRRSAGGGASHDELRRQGFRRGLGAAAIALGIAGIAIVFFALPRWVSNGEPVHPVDAAAAVKPLARPAQEPVERKEIDFAALARAKQEAEERRAPLDERLQKLRARAADQWGGEEFKRAGAELEAGDKDFAAREYASAVEHFASMEPLLAALEKRAGEVLADQLKLGATALQQGRSADAKAAFQLAAKIEPGNKVAAHGLARAGTLDEVLALVASAERFEREGNPNAAIGDFRKALALDAQAPRAADGIARIEAALAGDAFASAMARGYSALASADYTNARSAFEAARRIRPNAPEIAQALKQIEQEQRTTVISAKLRNAKRLEAAEQWADALKEYRAVVELDSTVAAANEGVARVSPRAALNERLELYLTQPERLFSQPVRASAKETLASAAKIEDPGPVLKRQLSTLREWIARADVPVQVALQSDNLTQVTIYRVGTLGAFAQRSLELAPGSYTVVGTRPGYRDVRRQINVTPGTAPDPVVIRCEDRI